MDTPTTRIITPARVVALALIAVLVGGLAYARFGTDAEAISVPAGAEAGDLILEPCEYTTEDGAHAADCGTLVVPENRADPQSRLIALPVTRIHARSENPAEPIFYLQGGPGIPNDFDDPSYAARFTDSRDVVLVGYRGVEGSSVLECPEVSAAMTRSSDLVDEASLQRFGDALIACADRLGEEGVDLDGYTLTQRVEDMEAVRAALGHDRVNLLSESAGTRTAMIYAWRHPESIHRSVMIGVNPPGHYLWDPKTTDDQLHHYADLCSKDEACRRRTEDLAGTIREVAADMPERWLFLPINEGNVKAGSFYGLMETSSAAAPLIAPMILDAWLSAADGDPSGLWLQSFVMSALYPDKAWGEQAATGIIDAPYAEEYYASGGDPGSILGNAATDFMWAGGLLTDWPAGPDDTEYRHVQPSDVETLLIGGTLDFSTPPGNATDELLPFLSNGHQVVLTDVRRYRQLLGLGAPRLAGQEQVARTCGGSRRCARRHLAGISRDRRPVGAVDCDRRSRGWGQSDSDSPRHVAGSDCRCERGHDDDGGGCAPMNHVPPSTGWCWEAYARTEAGRWITPSVLAGRALDVAVDRRESRARRYRARRPAGTGHRSAAPARREIRVR